MVERSSSRESSSTGARSRLTPNRLLARYLQPEVLNYVAEHEFQPRHLVIGHLSGHHRSPAAGFAVEFSGHREYVPG